ncbi:tetratricopeptide repeat protein [Prevotella sp.]|uniref:tetratricopeptide repeat protein n=1 Tax=Prevotella sp. TaxID=59823 RepID=UPI00307A29E4
MNTKEKIEQLKRDAEAGDASAQNILACAYYNGDGVEKDIPTALDLFEKSAAGGDNYGLSNLAYRYRYGKDGYAKDLKKAFGLYLQAAEQGHVSAQEIVGIFYDWGYGVEQDYKKAVEWYTKAANKGHSVAQNNLGSKYEKGLGVEKNPYIAFNWYMNAALQEEEYAMCNVGILFEEGNGVPKSYKNAMYWYEKSANKGHERAAKRLKELKEKYDRSIDEPCINFPYLANNPFRLLGVYSNSSIREISANKSKMSVFLKIGKTISLPLDKVSNLHYSPVYPILTDAFRVEINDSVEILYNKIISTNDSIEFQKKRKEYLSYDENDDEQTSLHNEIVGIIKTLNEELCTYQSYYETKRKELFSIHRSEENIEEAIRRINQPFDKLTYALFWYIKISSRDEEIIEALSNGDTDKALELCNTDDMSSVLNSAVIEFGLGHYDSYIHKITKLIHDEDYLDQFVTAVCGDNYNVSEKELSHALIDILLRDMPSIDWERIYYNKVVSAEEDKYICEKIAKQSIEAVEELINSCANIEHSKVIERYRSALNLKDKSQTILQGIEYYVEKDSFLYQSCADKIARELISCAIDYYKKCKDTIYSATKSCYDLIMFADRIAVGSSLKEKTQEYLSQLKGFLDNLPPESSFELFKKVNKIINNYENKEETVKNGLALLQECAPLIAEIKEDLGKSNKSYIDLSTSVADLALSFSITELNLCFKELEQEEKLSHVNRNYVGYSSKIEHLRELIKITWKLFLNINKFDMDSNFITNREKPNKDIIAKYLDDFHISSYLIHADIDMRTETDIFNECKTIAEYKRYISKFPSGKFVKEAENRIKLLTKQDDDYWEICYKGGNYSEYLSKYPSGRHSNEAKSKIEQEDDNYWEICNKSGDYMLYVKKYPEGIHTDEAYRKDAARKAAVFTVIFIIVIIASLIFYTISRQ